MATPKFIYELYNYLILYLDAVMNECIEKERGFFKLT